MHSAKENVELLAIFHWVVAGLAGLFSFIPLVHVGMGVAMLRGAFRVGASDAGPPAFLGWFMIGFGVIFCLGVLTYAAALGFTAKSYSRHRHWTFCLVMAVVSCAWFPFGTVLGVFSILTLARPETKALFGEGQPVTITPAGALGERAPFG